MIIRNGNALKDHLARLHGKNQRKRSRQQRSRFKYKRNPGLSLRVVQGSFRKNSNVSWIPGRVIVAVCFRSPLLNPQRYMHA